MRESWQGGRTPAQHDGECPDARGGEPHLASTGPAESMGLQLANASSFKVVLECAEVTLECNPRLELEHRMVWRTRDLAALMVTDGYGIFASQFAFSDVVLELHDCTLPAHAKRSHPPHSSGQYGDETALVRGIDRSLSAPVVSQFATFGRAGRQFQMKDGNAAAPRSNGHHGRRSYDLHSRLDLLGEEVRDFPESIPSLIR